MKIGIAIFSTIVSATLFAQEINWLSFDDAQEAQKKIPKKIIMDVYTEWCGPCKLLDMKTFHNSDVAKYINEHFYAVKFNAEGNEEFDYKGIPFFNPKYDPNKSKSRNSKHIFASYIKVTAYPTIVFFDEKADIITPLVGYFTPKQLELYLKLFTGDTYKTVTTREQFEDYRSSFISDFAD